MLTGSLGPYTVAATLIDRPIPWSQLEGPCTMAWYWPEAADALCDHSNHLLVTLIDEGSKSTEKGIYLTQLVTALVGASSAVGVPAAGIFWGPGRMVHEPQAFTEQALQMSPENLPLFLWIDFRIEPADDQQAFPDLTGIGPFRLFTTGLDALGQPELEIPSYTGKPQPLLEYAYNVAHYLLDQKKTVKDGESIGLTDQLKATAHYRPSMCDADLEVLQLEIGPIE